MKIHPIIDPFAIHYDTFDGSEYKLTEDITIETLGSEIVSNGDFSAPTNWTFNPDWSYNAGLGFVDMQAAGAPNSGTFTQVVSASIILGRTYRLTYTIGIAGAPTFSVIPTVSGETLTTRTTAGTFSEDFTPSVSGLLVFTGSVTGGTGFIFVDDVSIKELITTTISAVNTNRIGKDLNVFGDLTSDALTIRSTDGSDQIDISHDNTNAFFKWNDGVLQLQTDEGTDTSTTVQIKGKGARIGVLNIFEEQNTEWLSLYSTVSRGVIEVMGSNPIALRLQPGAETVQITCFENSTSGETKRFGVVGFRAGDEKRLFFIATGVDAADTTSFFGVSNYLFGGNLITLNDTHEDTDGGRESRHDFKGEQSGGEQTTLARIEASHDGAADDQLGKMVLSVNTGAGLVSAVEIDSNATTKIGDLAGNDVEVSNAGDVDFKGGAGLVSGSFWGNDIGFVAAGGSGVFFEIFDGDITTGQLHNVTHNTSSENTLDIGAFAGMYLVNWSISAKATGANKHLVGAIGVDAGGGAGSLTAQNDGRSHAVSTGNAEFSISGTAILDLSANSEVGLMATNETDGTNVTVEHVSLSIVQIGGT